jgi:spermidine synthase
VKKSLCKCKTPFQRLEIVEAERWGRILILDDIIECTELDEFVYHEMLTHVPMYMHPNPKRVLIIGGGDGGILREVLRHPVEQVVMVEIDKMVVEACAKYAPFFSAGAFDDPRAELLFDDGAAYVRNTDRKFDVVIVDSTDPVGPGEVLFGQRFYRDVVKRLTPGGMVVRQTGSTMLQPEEFPLAVGRAREVFSYVHPYLAATPSYVGGFFSLLIASNRDLTPRLRPGVLEKRVAKRALAMRYYTPGVHRAAFELPPYVAERIGRK